MVNVNRLRAARIQQGMTQMQVAQQLGIALSSYALKERGKRTFDCSEATKICEMFHINEPGERALLFLN